MQMMYLILFVCFAVSPVAFALLMRLAVPKVIVLVKAAVNPLHTLSPPTAYNYSQ